MLLAVESMEFDAFMQAKRLSLLSFALVVGSLLGVYVHPVAGSVFVSALLAYVLFSTAFYAKNSVSTHYKSSLNRLTDSKLNDVEAPLFELTDLSLLDEISVIVHEVVQESMENLTAQIGVQSDAVRTLSGVFEKIQSLLEQQHYGMKKLLNEQDTKPEIHVVDNGLLKKSEKYQRAKRDLDMLVEQLVSALHGAMRALQFEDMSTQNMRYIIQRLEELVPIASALQDAGNGFSQLGEELLRYRESPYRQKHNPVSASSVTSGSVDLF